MSTCRNMCQNTRQNMCQNTRQKMCQNTRQKMCLKIRLNVNQNTCQNVSRNTRRNGNPFQGSGQFLRLRLHLMKIAFSSLLALGLSGILTAAPNTDAEPFEARSEFHAGEAVPDLVPKAYRNYPRVALDGQKLSAAGLRLLKGTHVTIVTDLPDSDSIARLPDAVDEAYPQLCTFFGVKPDASWRLTVFLMKNNLPFMQADCIPEVLPPFQNGFSFNYDCWAYEQPSEYYREHLILHEMVHSFSTTTLGNAGPSWFAEGLAELLGMHDMSASPILLGWMPANKASVPYCGRIREIHDAIARGEARTFEQALHPSQADYGTNAMYYWSWAFAWFLENNPDTHAAFRDMIPLLEKEMTPEAFTETFVKSLGEKRPEIEKQWLMFIASLEYGFSLPPALFDAAPGTPLKEKTVQKIRADRGWQNTGIHVQKGERIRIRAKGRFELFQPDGEMFPCEPNGITIRYVSGAPLGALQAVILTDAEELTPEIMNDRREGTFYTPLTVGASRTFTVPFDGTLLLRANDLTTNLEKNKGEFLVEISERK